MEKRFQVFVSSTFVDLVDERRAVMQALLEQDCIPAGMELFLASDQDQWELIQGVIDYCDYYVVIVGARYGSLTEDGVSFTEKEFDYAVEKGIPILGFVHASPEQIEIGKGERSEEGQRKLEAFVKKVMERPVKRFSSAAELAAVVGASVARETRRRPGIGWVRGDQAMTPETEAELSELRARVAELERDKAQEETSGALADTSDLAQGADLIELPYQLGNRTWGTFSGTHTGAEEFTWDDIIKALGPMMIDEAAEPQLRNRLGELVLARLVDEDRVPEELLRPGREPAVEVAPSEFDRIKVQLRALNLIDKGTKRRTVADKQTYWALTEHGDRYLASLLAIRR